MSDNTEEITRLVNRHMARLMTDLEEAGCPTVFKNAAKSAIVLIRSAVCYEGVTVKEAGDNMESISNVLLDNLNKAWCNAVYVQAVEHELGWLRSDVLEILDDGVNNG